MEYQEGPDRPQKTEIEKITEEIEDMEYEERLLLIKNKKSASSKVYAANILALFFFILWSEVAKDGIKNELLLVFSLIPLLAIFCLFIVFRQYDFKQKNVQKYFRNNFYALFLLFIVLTTISIFKV